jgi:hypothetical protein
MSCAGACDLLEFCVDEIQVRVYATAAEMSLRYLMFLKTSAMRFMTHLPGVVFRCWRDTEPERRALQLSHTVLVAQLRDRQLELGTAMNVFF